ncbi:hypothetical protein [Stenotrophomonas maltophilia]|nr:hypothetical protein [Stenotrophomonas maltophilia]
MLGTLLMVHLPASGRHYQARLRSRYSHRYTNQPCLRVSLEMRRA